MKYVYLTLFLALILAANYVTTEYGMIPVGVGLTATAGTYFAGLTFVVRDSLQDTGGRWFVLGGIVAGAAASLVLALTWFRADPTFLPPGVTAVSIALASGIAFLCSESADWCIYTPLRRKGYVRAAVASNVVGTLVDTVLFLSIAGFPIWASFAGQVAGKFTVTAVVVGLVVIVRWLSSSRILAGQR